MPAAAITTLALTGVLVLALAVVLLWVIVLLARILRGLGRVDAHVAVISDRTEPIEPMVSAINRDLRDVADEFEGLTRAGPSGGEVVGESRDSRRGGKARPSQGGPDL